MPRYTTKLNIVRCPVCQTYAASARTLASATEATAQHIVAMHDTEAHD